MKPFANRSNWLLLSLLLSLPFVAALTGVLLAYGAKLHLLIDFVIKLVVCA